MLVIKKYSFLIISELSPQKFVQATTLNKVLLYLVTIFHLKKPNHKVTQVFTQPIHDMCIWVYFDLIFSRTPGSIIFALSKYHH